MIGILFGSIIGVFMTLILMEVYLMSQRGAKKRFQINRRNAIRQYFKPQYETKILQFRPRASIINIKQPNGGQDDPKD